LALVFALLAALGLAAVTASGLVAWIYGPSYTLAVYLLAVLVIAAQVREYSLRTLMGLQREHLGELRVLIAATGAAASLNVVLNALLIPLYGMSGAALATTIGYGSLSLFQVYGARYIGYQPFRNARLPQIGLTALFSGLVIAGLAGILGSTTLAALGVSLVWGVARTPIALLIVPPIGLLFYAGLALATGAIDIEEIEEILERVPGPISTTIQSLRK
jgi:O-antigen/teichoic acid export membrane protein